ncbi:MAG: tetratricopeptide (TPR) repeat protein [Halieaceae bacterium]|jgi:tetratricopeptide (TPR) repeat protein
MAERVCRQALQEMPKDPNLLCLLGASLIKQQKVEQAEKPLSRAVKMFPDFSRAHEGLAEVFMMQGKLSAARECLQIADKLEPNSRSIQLKLGKVLAGLGLDDDAGAAFEASFKLTPHREELIKGLQQQRMGDLKEAEAIYRGVLSQDPDDVDALRLMAGVAMKAKQWGDAIVLLEKALKISPDFFQGWMDLGQAHQEQDQVEEAMLALAHARRLEPHLPNAYTASGTVAAMSGEHEAARAFFAQALEQRAGHAGALAGMGHVLKTVGRNAEAIEAYRSCAEHNPGHGEAYWSLANLKTFRFEDAEVAAMQEQIADPSLGDEPKANFLFALGKAFEDRNNYDQAFAYYQQGNDTRRRWESYDPVNTLDTHDKLLSVFNPELLAGSTGHSSNAPIFIVGLPRSGSTLIEQILASHPLVEGTHELPELSRVARTTRRYSADNKNYPESILSVTHDDFEALGADFLQRAERHRAGETPFFTDKLPNNFAHIGLLQTILPNAKVIDARRHPLDSCFGSFKQLFARGQPFTYDLYEVGEFYLEYLRVMDHWHKVLPGKVLQVQYEDVVADLETQVRRILEYCELPWDPACLSFYETERAVKTASSEQVRQPIYASSVQSWRNFESHLGPLIEVLEPVLRELPEEWHPASFS